MNGMVEGIWNGFKTEIIIASILLVTIILAMVITRLFDRFFTEFDQAGKLDKTTLSFIRRLVISAVYIIGVSAALFQIPQIKIVGQSLLAGAGILTLLMGLASQQILSNLFSGVLIIIFKPFRLGDRISVSKDYMGIVEDITLRETILRDFENNRIIVPNSLISSQILVNANYTDNRICKFIEIGVSYSADVEKAMAIMAEEVAKHPLNVDNRTEEQKQNGEPEVSVRVISLGASSVNLRAWAWANTPPEGFVLQCDLLQSIKARFDQSGIEIPFPQTTISFAKTGSLAVTTSNA